MRLFQQSMVELDLMREYDTVLVACGSLVSMEIMTENHDPDLNVIVSRRRYTSRLEGRADEVEFLNDTYRWYEPQTVTKLLISAGLPKVQIFGGYDSSPLAADSAIALFLAE